MSGRAKVRKMSGTMSAHLLALAVVLALGALCLTHASKVTVSSLQREVDLTTQGLVVASVLAIKNKERQPLSSFVYCASKIVSDKKLLWIEFEEGDSSTDESKKLAWALDENECMEVALSSPVPAKGETTVEVYEIFSMDLVPVSRTIHQSETQLVKFSNFDAIVRDANLEIEKQSTKFYLPSKAVSDYTEVEPSKRDGGEISYGPYKASDAASKDGAVTLIFENPEAMLLVESVVRDVTVSSWTDIEVEEHYHIKNVGPAFKEGFNRVEYGRKPMDYITELFSLELPKQAHSLFFKDVLGNITTSHTRFESSKVTVEAVPRFPLIGGWQTHFTFGYKLPVSPFLKSKGSEKTLVMAILPALQQVYIKNLTINTAVPEFSTGISGAVLSTNAFFKASDPFRTVKTLKGKKNHYFDLSGRPVHTMQISEVAPELRDVGELQYYVNFVFAWKYYMKEPLMMVVFACLLALVFVLPSLDFRLVRKQKSD
jgi:oligosaccharyltransferase complex subunit alpha (ribophorin I)